MKHSSAALLAAFLLLLSACGANQTADVSTTAGDETNQAASEGGDRSSDSSADGESDTPGDGTSIEDSSTAQQSATDDSTFGTLQSVLLRKSSDTADSASSARFSATVSITGTSDSDTPGEFSLAIDGAYDIDLDASRISIDMSDLARLASETAGQEDSDLGFMAAFLGDGIEVVTIGEQAWIKWALLTMFTGAEDKWLESSVEDTGDMTADFGFDGAFLPEDLLEMWGDAPGELEDLGVDDVRGAEATHYRVTIDADTLAASMSDSEWSDLGDDLGVTPAGEVILELWIDDEGRLHRYAMDISDPSLAEAGEDVVAMSFVFEIWDHGADVEIAPPAAEDIITEDQLTFGFDADEAFEDLEG